MSTGAVVVGRRTFEFAGGWGGDHHDGVPIFVLSRREADARDALARGDLRAGRGRRGASAKDAAGDKGRAGARGSHRRLALTAGVLDELQIHLVPVLFGQGRRLFENMPPDHIELELVRALDGPGVQHLRYRVRKEG